jgi:hypothetical protein
MRSCPPKPCSPPAATAPRPSRGFPRVVVAPWGRVTARAVSGRCVHRVPLPS